jgi:hypothetical protein
MRILYGSIKRNPVVLLSFTLTCALLFTLGALGSSPAQATCVAAGGTLCVTANSNPPAVSNTAQIIESGNDVTWISADGGKFKITPKSGNHNMTVTPTPAGAATATLWTGEQTGNCNDNCTFSYNIVGPNGTLDPDIIIEPGTSPGPEEAGKHKHHRKHHRARKQ